MLKSVYVNDNFFDFFAKKTDCKEKTIKKSLVSK